MAANMKSVKLRIKSVESTMQITKAMELVASSKLRKAKDRADTCRPYFRELHQTLVDIAEGNLEHMMEEYGDLLFASVNTARFMGVDPEDALNAATEKFIRRFRQVEQLSQARGQALDACSVDELVALWKDAKHTLDDTNP